MAKIEQFGVKAGETAVVEGSVVFSSLTKKDERQTPNSKYPTTPNYNIVLGAPRVTSASTPAMQQYIESTFYTSNSVAAAGQTQVRLRSTGNVPRIFDKASGRKAGVPADELLVGGELANGQTVSVAVSIFQSSNYSNLGEGIQGVLIDDANNIQYYQGAGITLDAFGITPNPDAPAFEAPAQPAGPANQAPAQPQAPQQPAQPAQTGFANPAAGPFSAPAQPAQPNPQAPAQNVDPFDPNGTGKPFDNNSPFG